jgi:hypothetical protein
VQQLDSGGAQGRVVVTVFGAQVDYRGNSVHFGKVFRTLHGKAAANGEPIAQPVEIGRPVSLFAGHEAASFFITIFFFIFFFRFGDRYCCS